MAKKGQINPQYEFAKSLAIESGNGTHANTMRFLREIATLKKWDDHSGIERTGFNGVKVIGYTLEEVVDCWRWIRTRDEFPIVGARLSTTLTGSPCELIKFDQYLMENLPPVY